MLKNRAQKTQTITKNYSKMARKNDRILGEMPIGAPLVVQTVFVMKKLAPNAPKVRPRTNNEPKIPTNDPNVNQTLLQKEPRE